MQGVTLPHANHDNTPCKARRDRVQLMTPPHANCPDFVAMGKLTYPYPYKGEGGSGNSAAAPSHNPHSYLCSALSNL